MKNKIAIVVLVLLLVGVAARCQELTLAAPGVIAVVVVDSNVQPLSGVAVTLSSQSDGDSEPWVQFSPPSGAVTFEHLGQGSYSVRCELSGFFTATLSHIPVDLGKFGPRLPSVIRVALPAGPIFS